ncbi:MAG: pyridoxamine 5'-phosphate oxidase family protein, partial [Chloroflexota bacterium]
SRSISGEHVQVDPVQPKRGKVLSSEQTNWIRTADTFFVASSHPEKGTDASHRGGNPGFIQVDGNSRLVWPDYSGNMMFNTLGNIAANPKTGLLFIDFKNNRTLQLTGRANIVWEADQIAEHPGAERLVSFKIDEVIELQNVSPFVWTFNSSSPFNPAIP